MTSDAAHQSDSPQLWITLSAHGLPISQLSRLLRVLQTAVREVASDDDDTQPRLEQQHQPRLLLSANVEEDRLILSVAFADLGDSTPLPELSQSVFVRFIEHFDRFLRTGPQLGLWGPVGRSAAVDDEPVVTRRLRELHAELRHFSGATVNFGDRSFVFDGDQVTLV